MIQENSKKKKGIGRTLLRLFFIFLFIILNFGFLRNYLFHPFFDDISSTIEYEPQKKYSDSDNNTIIERSYQWKFVDRQMVTRKCKLSLSLLQKDVYDALYHIEEVGNMSVTELGVDQKIEKRNSDAFQWQLWNSVFSKIYFYAYQRFDYIVEHFRDVFRQEKLSKQNQLLFILTFIQNIRYERPGGAFDLLPPMVTLDKQLGDCDTKTILLYVILEKMGIDCVMMWSYKYRHAMLGIAAGKTGDYKQYKGKRYYFFETTYPNWEVGELPPKTRKKTFWHVMDLDENNTRYNNTEFKKYEQTRDEEDHGTTDAERRKQNINRNRENSESDHDITDAERRKKMR